MLILGKKKCLLYIVIGIFSLFLACLSTNYDYDLFARLIVGERFIEYGILPFQDFLSYTPTHPWYDHEWGSGVIFYFILKHLDAFGLFLFQALMFFLTTFFVIKTQKLQKHAYPTSIIFISLFMIIFQRLNPELIRCQLFSFLFFSIFLYILEGTRIGKFKNLIWIFPPIVIFWNNVHGGVVSGLGLIAMYFAGAILEKKPWKKYLGVLVTSGLLLIINPYGIKYLTFLFSATTKQRTYIVEWWSIFAHSHIQYYLPLSIFPIFAFICTFLKKRKIDITKTIVLIVTLYLGIAHVKLLSLSVISAASLCYNDIISLFSKNKRILKKLEKSIYAAIIILAFSIPLFSPTAPRASLGKFPLYEIEFLKINNIKGNIVVPFGFGSYASYKLYPNNLIFMDGRYEEVYNEEEFMALYYFITATPDWKNIKQIIYRPYLDSLFFIGNIYNNEMNLKNLNITTPSWKDITEKYPTDILMPHKASEMYNVLITDPNWVHIFDGRQCGIFVKKGNEKFSYFEPEYDINYYRKTMFKHGDFIND